MQKELVSVIIPTYNRAPILFDTLQSVLGQTYRPIEILVVDDGSTDDTRLRLGNFSIGKQPLRIFENAHAGVAAARNTGMAAAQGEFVAFCDSDDLWLPEKLKLQVALLKAHPDIGLVYSDAVSFRGREIETPSYFSERPPHKGWVFHRLIETNFIPTSSVLVRKRCLDAVGEFRGIFSPSEDYEFWLRFCQYLQVGFIPQALVKLCRHSGNLTVDEAPSFDTHLKVLDSIKERFGDRIPQKVFRKAYGRTYRHLGYHHLLRHRFQEARGAFLKSWQFNPFSSATYRYLAVTLFPEKVLERLLSRRGYVFSEKRNPVTE